MKNRCLCFLLILAGFIPRSSQALTFAGTNSPGESTNFTFSLNAEATNLSLVVSNTATAYSWLYLQSNGTPTTNSYEFTSRLVGLTNQINLESPEYAPGTYGLLVSTPSTSMGQTFNVVLATNLNNLRTVTYPVSKPLVFSTTGFLTNSGSGAWQYFQVDVPSNLLTGWRVVVSSSSVTPPSMYINRGQLPTTGSYVMATGGSPVETITFNSTQATAGTYFIGIYLPNGAASSANYVLGAELASLNTLTWDPGATQPGTQVYTNESTTGGDYFFAITTETTANGVWRNALNVQSGQASLYLLQGSLPTTGSYNYASTMAGSNGFVLAQGQQFSPGQNWYILVHATPNAQWNLVTGQAYVQQLPALAADSSSGATVTMGAEGMAFFQTTITSNTLAWQLGLNGLTNQVLVKSTLAPTPLNSTTYDLIQDGQMLVVPSYLNIGSQYFVGVVGSPGLNFTLDSRQQSVTTIPFNYTNSFMVTNYGYATFLVQVPVQQIAWQINLTPTAGDAYVAANLDSVPNEFVNLAFSEAPGDLEDSITLVPPTLTDGSFYVTTYGTPPYTCTLFNGNPVITTVDYLFSITNDEPDRVGWRFYQVLNTNNEQVNSLGWELDLSNAPAGSEIAIRRNAVPGDWDYRNDPYDYYGYSTLGYSDLSSTTGFLQQPNHPADVWYIGVYSPASALGGFVLTGSDLTGPPVGFDGAGNVVNVTNQPATRWDYFTFTVPTNAFGWDLRLTNVTSGDPQMYVCLSQLPSSSPAGGVNSYYDGWPSGYQWNVGSDATGYPYDPDGQYENGWVVSWGTGNPLEPGTYYVGVTDQGGTTPLSYSLSSRGIGTDFSIPIIPLAFSNGISSSALGLNPRQAAYYSVVIPSNTPSWRVELDTNIGDAALVINDYTLPDSNPYGYPPWDEYGGFEMNKLGDQQYLMMPVSGQSNIYAGTYYLAVVSEGVNPVNSTIGSNSSTYTIGSYGSLNITNMGTVNPSGASDLLETNLLSKSGQICAYSFTVPSNTLSLEIFLTNTTGSPYMTLLTGNQLPGVSDSYGNNGGQGATWYNSTLINIPNPTVTNYTLMVQAEHAGGDASYTVQIHAIGPQTVAFDGPGNTWTITNQAAGLWQYFTINVPTNATGWDLRLTNVSYSNGQTPQMYVCQGVAPSFSPAGGVNSYYQGWPADYQWSVGADATGYPYDPDGQLENGWVVSWGMGNPLEPGLYYIGVINNNTGANLISYTLTSRGIGTGFSIPVVPLAFSNGISSSASGLNPRQAAYYSVVIPSNTPSWRVELDTNIGDAALVINDYTLPDSNPYGYPPWDEYGGFEMNKVGDQQYLMMPVSGQSNIYAGTYYLAVVSEGVNPVNSTIGSNSSTYTIGSYGSLNITNMGTVNPSGASDLLETNLLSKSGQICAYSFTVPSNTLSLEIFLTNTTGSPYMTLLTGNQLPGVSDSYGNNGGQGATWYNSTLINIPNPTVTNYTLMVQAEHAGGDASYTVQIHAIGPQTVAFDGPGNTWAITNQGAGLWQYFTVTVPDNALGWDLRLTNVSYSNGQTPQMYVCKGTLPSFSPAGGVNSYYEGWPNGYQWNVGADATGYPYDPDGQLENGWVVSWGMGNPLQPGLYYIGVINNSTGTNQISYTLASRGIGTGFSIPVTPLAFSNGVFSNTVGLNPRQADYYSVVVPPGSASWKVRLTDNSGETALIINDTTLPDSNPVGYPPWDVYGGLEWSKLGNEQYLMLPINAQSYSNDVVSGTYYLAVIGQGINPSSSTIGTNSSYYTINSFGVQGITNLGTVSPTDILQTNAIQGGENALYQFTISANLPAVEVRLDNVTASPYMTLQTGTNVVAPEDSYGYSGGVSANWSSATLITLPNPTATNYSLTVQAAYNSTASAYLNADFTVHIRQMPTPALAFDPSLNSGSFSNVASGSLLDGESAFYEVVVPATNLDGSPVIGWTLTLSQTLGTPSVRVRPGLLPDNNGSDGTSPFSTGEAIIVPTYLTPGTWYVEVRASGATDYTLTSASLRLNRPAWTMQSVGGTVTTPGLPASGPLFADTGVDTNGIASTNQGQGSYLAEGSFDYYEIIVPTNNTGVLRTRLDAISGNPNLYIRAGGAPTLSHNVYGQGGTLYDRSLTASAGSEYGNWVPLNSGRYETNLAPGPWYLAVQAGGGSDISYRLRMDTGSISNLSLNNGSYANQSLTAGDWVYYAAYIRTNAPVNWNVTFAVQLGNVIMHVRDTPPPGQGATTTDLRDWATDSKNEGPYPVYSTAGTYTINTPPLRTGATYYLGFEATADAEFSVSCTTNGGLINITNTIAFDGGSISSNIPGYGLQQYLIEAPPTATRLLFSASNSTALAFSLENGTPLAGSQAQWYSASANVSFNQVLATNSNWPWVPGYSYYLSISNTSATAQSFTFTLSQPADLTPFSFTVPSTVTGLKPDPVIQVVWGVSNQGPATASGNWYDTVWFSTDGMLDSSSINLGNFGVNGPVAAGGTYHETNNVTLPMTASGPYTLFVQVDAGDSIYEASLSDKTAGPASGTFALTPPDLVPISVTAPATVTTSNSDPSVQVSWTVTNQGTGAATGGWYDRVWYSTDGALDASSTDIGDFYFNQTVPAQGEYSVTNAVTLPITLGGTYSYTLFVQVNVYDASYLYESSYANNISTGVPGTVTLDQAPKITTQPISKIAAPGTSVTFNVTATGTPTLYYQWRTNNVNLNSATSAMLVLNNVQAGNSGAYVVVITNAFGSVTSTIANLFVGSAGTNCVTVPSNLVSWWPAESNAYDVVSGDDGTLQNGVDYTPGEVGTAFSFSGANEAVLIPYSTTNDFSLMPKWTIEAWVNPTSFNNAGYPTIYAKGHWDASLGLNSGTGALESWINNNSQMIGTTPVPLNQWSHVALVYDGTNRTFYLNGAVAGSGTAPTITHDTSTSSIGNVVPNDGAAFNGAIDEVSIYNRALSFDEIASIYLAGAYGKCEAPPPAELVAISFSANTGCLLWVYGQINQIYTLQASPNLTNWVSILTFTCTNIPTPVIDAAAASLNHRFYRLANGNLLSPITLGFSSPALTSNGVALTLQGSIGPNYLIQSSTDLFEWLPVTNFAITNSPFNFIAPTNNNYKWLFYRAIIP